MQVFNRCHLTVTAAIILNTVKLGCYSKLEGIIPFSRKTRGDEIPPPSVVTPMVVSQLRLNSDSNYSNLSKGGSSAGLPFYNALSKCHRRTVKSTLKVGSFIGRGRGAYIYTFWEEP